MSSSSLTWWLGTGMAAMTFVTTRPQWRTLRLVVKTRGEARALSPRAT